MRYPIKASVVFAWDGPAGRLHGDGITRDVSGRGAYIRTSTCPASLVTVEIEIFLPPIPGGVKSVTIATRGQVIRVDHGEDYSPCGFALASEGFGLVYIGAEQN